MIPQDQTLNNRYRVIYTVDERPGSTVFRVRDEQTNRLMLVAAIALAPGELEDLQLLVRQVATIHHDMVLAVLDHFVEGERYYVVCEDVSGQEIERTLRARGEPFSEAEALAQARLLLEALEHLHGQKPALFLGDPLASDLLVRDDGAWRLTPFAMIRPIGSAPSPYRAPELDQTNAEPTPASDLYALTALFYQALTGWPPPTAAQRQAGTPLNGPRSLNPKLSPLAEQVLLRGLQARPENRYQVPREMHLSLNMVQLMAGRSLGSGPDALPGIMQAEPLPATQPAVAPPTPAPIAGIYQAPPAPGYAPALGATTPLPEQPYPAAPAPKRGLRTGCLVGLALALLLAAVAVCAALAWFIPGSPLPSLLGSGAPAGATAATAAPASAPSAAPAEAAPTAAPSGAPLPTLEPTTLGAGAITLQNATQITQTREITSAEVGPVAYSPDGALLAVGISNVINLRDPATLEEFEPSRQLAGHTGKLFTLAFSPDSALLASGAIDENTVRVWDVASGRQLRALSDHAGWIRAVAFAPDGKTLASGSFDSTVKLWDVASGDLLHTLSGHTAFISTVAFAPDGKTLATSSADGRVLLWDVASGAQRTGFSFEPAPNLNTGAPLWATGLAFSKDGATLAVGSEDGSIVLVDAGSGANRSTLLGHSGIVVSRALVFAPDGKTLASGSFDGTVRLWDVASGAQTAELREHGLRVLALSFSPDGARLASSSDQSGQLIVWDVARKAAERSLQIGQGLVTSLEFSPDATILGTVGYNGTTRLNLLDDDSFRVLYGSAAALNSLAFLPDGRMVAIASEGQVAVLATGDAQGRVLSGLDERAVNVAVAADGSLIVAGGAGGAIARWDASGTAMPTLRSDRFSAIYSLAVSGDGSLIAVGGPRNDPRVEIWDAIKGELIHTLNTGETAIAALKFQPRGAQLAVANLGGKLLLWNARAGELVRAIDAPPQQGRFSALAFSPDGALLMTGSPNSGISFWDAQSGQLAGGFALAQDSGIFAASFSPDGEKLALALGDQTVRVFGLP